MAGTRGSCHNLHAIIDTILSMGHWKQLGTFQSQNVKIWELKLNLAKALPAKFKTVIKYKSCAPAAETSGKLTFVVLVFWCKSVAWDLSLTSTR